MVFWLDPIYFLLVLIPTLLISGGVQLYLRRTYAKWSTVRNGSNLNGAQVGQQLFSRTALKSVPLQRTPGALTDHFDPRANVVRLSEPVAAQPSIAAMAVTAHEIGHVQQYQAGSGLMAVRNILVPALRFSPTLAYLFIFLGIIAGVAGLLWIGIGFFLLVVIFSVLTIPIELDASRRALRMLDEANLLVDEQDRSGARSMLNAAALTYVGAAAVAILQLLYLIGLARR